jgi:predicted O-methyltransferase YrrM
MNIIGSMFTEDIASFFHFNEPSLSVATDRNKPLSEWDMEKDDAPILRYLFRNLKPRRHLEFGTWQGFGTLCCLEECSATVWTINHPDGELKTDGSWAYSQKFSEEEKLPSVSKNVIFDNPNNPERPFMYYQTDCLGFIGRMYIDAGLGHRVCQIYSDSRKWDCSNYPEGFFDSVFIDGGHKCDIVHNDTLKAIPLLRSGGIILWHDFYIDNSLHDNLEAVNGVTKGIDTLQSYLQKELSAMFWLDRSLLLMGVKK